MSDNLSWINQLQFPTLCAYSRRKSIAQDENDIHNTEMVYAARVEPVTMDEVWNRVPANGEDRQLVEPMTTVFIFVARDQNPNGTQYPDGPRIVPGMYAAIVSYWDKSSRLATDCGQFQPMDTTDFSRFVEGGLCENILFQLLNGQLRGRLPCNVMLDSTWTHWKKSEDSYGNNRHFMNGHLAYDIFLSGRPPTFMTHMTNKPLRPR